MTFYASEYIFEALDIRDRLIEKGMKRLKKEKKMKTVTIYTCLI